MQQRTLARIWRGRTRPEIANTYEAYIRAEGIPPLSQTSLGVQLLREDLEHETSFTVISYWPDLQTMRRFTNGEPTDIRHLARDRELLVSLPERIEIHRVLLDRDHSSFSVHDVPLVGQTAPQSEVDDFELGLHARE